MNSIFKKKTFAQRMVSHMRPFRPRNECTWENAIHCKWFHFAIGVLIATLLFSVVAVLLCKHKHLIIPKVNLVLGKLKLPQIRSSGAIAKKPVGGAPATAKGPAAAKKKKK